ncbi:MAG: hypothetical protein JSC161_000480 [Candidatus Tokpelaia sp. JSC161]|nr:MAG: hypothetical protein JSC161_000480 [Candidatus Tokpelaia sp. JSC161]
MEFVFSYPMKVSCVPVKGFHLTLQADNKANQKLARNHAILGVDKFSADLHVFLWENDGLRVKGSIKASVRQKCIITAEVVENDIDWNFDVFYISQKYQLDRREVFLDGVDDFDVFDGNEIDLGAVVEESFELSLDLYPRKSGASFDLMFDLLPEKKEISRFSHFSVLRFLKNS